MKKRKLEEIEMFFSSIANKPNIVNLETYLHFMLEDQKINEEFKKKWTEIENQQNRPRL